MQQVCLGTVQHGMDYGVNEKKRPPKEESIALFETAHRKGIRWLDTAAAYGDAEAVIGEFFRRNPAAKTDMKVISKLRPNCLDEAAPNEYGAIVRRELQNSLDLMGLDSLDGYLLHSSRYVFNNAILQAMAALKEVGLVRNVGVSIYTPEEAMQAAGSPLVDYIQIPYNVLDRRLLQADFFALANANGKTIFARSCFLQGLLLMPPDRIPPRLAHTTELVREFQAIAEGLALHKACVAFTRAQEAIDYLLIGVRNESQLLSDLDAFATDTGRSRAFLDAVSTRFSTVDDTIVMPSLWAK